MILKKFKLNNFKLKNRIVISPMCQYSSVNGLPSKWHYQHLLNLLTSGAGTLVLESTAVSKDARISKHDLCLYNNKQKESFKKLIKFLKYYDKEVPIVLQISHAGRKGSSEAPFVKSNSPLIKPKDRWKTYSASNLKKDRGWPAPHILSNSKMKIIRKNFIMTAKYADQSGFDGLEIHMAHGYLLHQFLSPISNVRNDQYGGNLSNRCRYPLEIAEGVRKFWPKNKLLGARITGLDHLKNGIQLCDSIFLAKKLKKIGYDYICVSSGGILTKTNLKFYKGFRLKIASKIKKNVNMITRTSGLMSDLKFSNNAIIKNKIDLVAIGRSFIENPNLIFKFAKKIGSNELIPNQYKRCF